MKFITRRIALLACSVAVNMFFVLSPASTVTLAALRCQEDCNADAAYCNGNCDTTYGGSGDAWSACWQQCGTAWTACSSGAACCNVACYEYCSWAPIGVYCYNSCAGSCGP